MAEAPERRRLVKTVIGVALIGMVACRGSSRQSEAQGAAPPPESEAPVALNPDVPIAYPPALFERKVEGDVTLRLFVDSTGKLIPESTRVAEPSGYPALDSAALAGAPALKFAPAKRHGIAVATVFLQPVEFRQVGTTRTGTVTLPPPTRPGANARPTTGGRAASASEITSGRAPPPRYDACRHDQSACGHDASAAGHDAPRHHQGAAGHECLNTVSHTRTSSRRSAGPP